MKSSRRDLLIYLSWVASLPLMTAFPPKVRADSSVEALPYFHILAVSLNELEARGHILNHTIDFLVNQAGLDMGRLVFVSTSYFAPYIPELTAMGILPSQIVFRPVNEALLLGG